MYFKKTLSLWAGIAGYFAVIGIIIYNLSASADPVLASTALHILPILVIYLGWFWSPIPARSFFIVSLVAVLFGVNNSPYVGGGAVVSSPIAMFTVLLMLLAFMIASYLRNNLQESARTDLLTGLPNKRGITEILRIEIDRSLRRRETLSIAVTDFDDFKQINDRYGHTYGDTVLKESADTWRRMLRGYDSVGRLGGDEFVFVFPQAKAEQAETVLQRLQLDSSHSWTSGIAEYEPGDTVDSLLAQADQHLYQRKHALKRGIPAPSIESKPPRRSESPKKRRKFPRQSHFSVMSSLVGAVAFIPIIMGLTAGEGNGGRFTHIFVWICVVFTAIAVIGPLVYGVRYWTGMSVWTGLAFLASYAILSFAIRETPSSINLVYAISILALYMGTFSGTRFSRAVILIGLAIVSFPMVLRAASDGTSEERAVVIATLVYSYIVCFVLFELSSFLYSRSRGFSEHDMLTGVLNRRGLNTYGRNELQRAKRHLYPLSVAILDCVGFKNINDTYGHAAGDEVLRNVAEHLLKRVEVFDLVVRTGGDEFLVLMPYLGEEEARIKVEEILVGSPIEMHTGVAEYAHGDTFSELLQRADTTLVKKRS